MDSFVQDVPACRASPGAGMQKGRDADLREGGRLRESRLEKPATSGWEQTAPPPRGASARRRTRRTRWALPIELVLLALVDLTLGIVLVLRSHPTAGVAAGSVGLLLVVGWGCLLTPFGRGRSARFEALVTAAISPRVPDHIWAVPQDPAPDR